ncbi:MAG: M20/M25/M40 family metallo-hydrolase [Geodermatophilaceae bacterium]|jgi:acetylornithine deacetylase/succinyl-diaminopimelate desuccinylase-like protein
MRSAAQDEVVELCRDLIRIDTTNTGDTATSAGERAAAEYVAGKLDEVGLGSELIESEPGRANIVARIPGADRARAGLLVHCHLDVVPAEPAEWSVHPFAGEVQDDYLWGRGAVDMKDMDAMTLAVVRQWMRDGTTPPRDIVLAFVADEEAGGRKGARWLVDTRPELFEGCSEAISEVGGFSLTVRDDLRLYLIETAEKGIGWMKLTARGRPGHGSMVNEDNAVARLCEAVARLGQHEFPIVMTKTLRAFLEAISEAFEVELDPDDIQGTLAKLGSLARIVGATLRNTANPTMLDAGYKANVIPSSATAVVDGRFLPGQEEEFERQLDEILGPDIEREWIIKDTAMETSFDGPLVEQMAAALKAEDPGAHAIPYMLSGGTDGKSFQRLGMRCFGFSPLRLPPDLDFAALFHGIDERVPLDALRFGTRVLDRFLLSS